MFSAICFVCSAFGWTLVDKLCVHQLLILVAMHISSIGCSHCLSSITIMQCSCDHVRVRSLGFQSKTKVKPTNSYWDNSCESLDYLAKQRLNQMDYERGKNNNTWEEHWSDNSWTSTHWRYVTSQFVAVLQLWLFIRNGVSQFTKRELSKTSKQQLIVIYPSIKYIHSTIHRALTTVIFIIN